MPRTRRIHPAWFVAAAAFVALMGAAAFRAAPGPLMIPLNDEFGWSIGVMSMAVSVNIFLYGLTAPFAAALIGRFGIRAVTSVALVLIAAGSGLTVFATEQWQLFLTWGVLIGMGTGSMALVFASEIAGTWFVARRGLVVGILSAGSATGQLVFLPLVASMSETTGWRVASLIIAGTALAVVPLVLRFIRNDPSDLGVAPLGVDVADYTPRARQKGAMRRALVTLRDASRVTTFWALAAAFAICGATTNGLVGLHFVPSAHDHGMSITAAAGLLAIVGVFDIIGTVLSGWLTDRVNPRYLLTGYYFFRGVGLAFLPTLLSQDISPSIVIFVVVYGLDWVATVPPTVALCREYFGDRASIVFGWVFAAHQVGAAIAATAAGFSRDFFGTYTYAWLGGAALCVVAAWLSWIVKRPRTEFTEAHPA
ncbi:putative MFS family arabinose efflux permease [Microbacteriaceae bacterium MWH-Ta3]|nr:putative MFS family arabinose efflux permease [Microbacteriaceae bacterium MWH-Ta3]